MFATKRVIQRCGPLLMSASKLTSQCQASCCRTLCVMWHKNARDLSSWRPCATPISPPVLVLARGMAGHSKWQNIRHIKAAKDDIKRRTNEKLVHRIKLAVKEGGGADPKHNARLASILLEGKKNNVPNATMENALKLSEKARLAGKLAMLEAIGPGHCHIMIETIADKPQWNRSQVQHILKKHGCRLGEGGTTAHSFEQKGVIHTEIPEGGFDLDAATDTAIEAGAEDVDKTVNDDDQEVLQFICGPKDLHAVRKELEELNHKPLVARLEYIPMMNVPVTEEQFEIFTRLVDALEDYESVIRVYSNIELQSS